MNELALFTGAGGGILGGHLLGWTTVAACEIEEYPRAVLLQRQLDGLLPRFPIWDDISTFDGKQFRGKIDIITGGFPCQDISAAGKGAGITGERSGLWGEMARIIGEVRPRFAFMENSPMLTSRGLGTVLGDLAEMGYDARWCVLGADDAGAPHRRKRIWILGYTAMHGQPAAEIRNGIDERSNDSETRTQQARKSEGSGSAGINEDVAYPDVTRLQRPNVRKAKYGTSAGLSTECSKITWWDSDPADVPDAENKRVLFGKRSGSDGERLSESGANRRTDPSEHESRERRPTKPIMGRVAHGVVHRVDRLKAIGNGQVPAVAAIAFLKLSEDL